MSNSISPDHAATRVPDARHGLWERRRRRHGVRRLMNPFAEHSATCGGIDAATTARRSARVKREYRVR